jgi:hypothetical protein
MSHNFTKIIALLNDFNSADVLLKKAFNFADENGASVEILYVHESPLFDIPDYFRSDIEEGIDKEKIKKEIQHRVAALNPKREPAIFVQVDDTPDRVWALSRDDKATLILTTYHDSITSKLIDTISHPILVLKIQKDTYQKVALILNTTSESIDCIRDAKSHFKESNMHLLYDYRYVVDPSMEIDVQNIAIIEEAQREAFEEIKKESHLEGEFFVDGSFFGDDLVQYIDERSYDIVYLCSRGDDFFVSDTLTSELLDRCECDLFVANKT